MSLIAAAIRLRPRVVLSARNAPNLRKRGMNAVTYLDQTNLYDAQIGSLAAFSSHISGSRPYRNRGLRISRSRQTSFPSARIGDQEISKQTILLTQNQDHTPSSNLENSISPKNSQGTDTAKIETKSNDVDSKSLPILDHPTTIVPLAPTGERGVIDRNPYLRQSVESILGQPTLVVTRQMEMLNIFLGYEQANKYSILTPEGYQLGYLVESESGLLGGALKRQFLRTHRSFEAHVMDPNGRILLKIKRPTTLINSRLKVFIPDPITGQERLVGEVHQNWHLYRRRYELFVNQDESINENGTSDSMVQFAAIDGGLLAWDFLMVDENNRPLGAISKNFRGIGRELFTDTGQYVLTFDPTGSEDFRIEAPQQDPSKSEKEQNPLINSPTGRELVESGPSRPLTMDERAVALATAISADFDYFSKHSQSHSHSMFPPFLWMGGGSGGQGEASQNPTSNPDGSEIPVQNKQDSSDIRSPPPSPGSDGGVGPAVGTGVGYDILGGGQQSHQAEPQNDQSNQVPWWEEDGSAGNVEQNDTGFGQEEVWNNEDPWSSNDDGDSGDSSWGWSDWLPGGGDSD